MNATVEKPTSAKSRKAQATASAPAPQPITAEANAATVVANTALSLVNAAATNPDWGYEGGSGYLAAYANVITDFIKSTLADIADSPFKVGRAVDTFTLCESITLALLAFDQNNEPEAIERQNLLAQASGLLGSARRGAECAPTIAFTQLAEGITAGKAAPPAADLTPSAEWSFMEGKALAALMVREIGLRDGGGSADLNASYRDPGQPQDNFTRPFLELVMKEPRLLEGFSAALSSMFAEGMDTGAVNYAHQADCTAKINYSACTTYRSDEEYEAFNSHSEPPLDEQLAKFALEDLVSVAPQAEPTAPEIGPQKQEASNFHRLSLDAMARAETKVSQALHLMSMIEDKHQSAKVFALTRLIDTLPPEIAEMMGKKDMGDGVVTVLDELLCSLNDVLTIIIAINEGLDDLGLHAVTSLLQMAKDTIAGAIDEAFLPQHEAGRFA